MNSHAVNTRHHHRELNSRSFWRSALVWALAGILAAFYVAMLFISTASAQQPLPSQPTPPKPATRPDTAKKPLPNLPKAPGVKPDYHPPALGLQLRDLDPAERKSLDVKSGVYVERAIGSAGSSGVHAEDVITKVNGRPVTDVDKFWKLAEASGWKFTATVQRGNTLISIAIDGT